MVQKLIERPSRLRSIGKLASRNGGRAVGRLLRADLVKSYDRWLVITIMVSILFVLVTFSAAASGTKETAAATTQGSQSPAVLAVKKAVANMEGPQSQWTGPTTGPKAATNKFIVYLSGQVTNNLSREYGQFMATAAKTIGWKYKVIGASGSPTSWLNGLNEAIALHPNGIAIFASASTLQSPILKAESEGITVIGLHASSEPGPSKKDHLFTNLESDPAQIGTAQGEYIAAASNGHAKVAILTHNEYGIAYVKSKATENELKKFPGIKLMIYENVPAAQVSSDLPSLTTSWVQRFGLPLFITSVGDSDFNFSIPSLRDLGVKQNQVMLVGSDGTSGAFARIRKGNQYEVATVPEPVELQAWQAIDDFNRAFNHMPPSNFVQPVHLVVHSNVDLNGGAQDMFNPANNYKGHFEGIWGVNP